MKVVLLGTGTSQGVPVLGCDCEVCKSNNPHDHRFRASALIETESTRILIDCGPDFREQMLLQPFRKIDAVLLTHIHYDHVGGIDDLRPFCQFGDIDIYTDSNVIHGLKRNMPYCFPMNGNLYPGVPKLVLHEIKPHQEFSVGDIDIVPITVMHDKLPVLGFRMNKLAYITDMKRIEDVELPYLAGIEVLIVNGLRWKREHHSHQLIDDAIAFSKQLGVKRVYLIHMTHEIGLHDVAGRLLPDGVEFGYDGETIIV